MPVLRVPADERYEGAGVHPAGNYPFRTRDFGSNVKGAVDILQPAPAPAPAPASVPPASTEGSSKPVLPGMIATSVSSGSASMGAAQTAAAAAGHGDVTNWDPKSSSVDPAPRVRAEHPHPPLMPAPPSAAPSVSSGQAKPGRDSMANAAFTMSDPEAILPDRITVLTCLGCGAMGREARCEGECSEHKLLLVDARDFDALQSAAQLARPRTAAFKPIARALLGSPRSEQACTAAYQALRAAADNALKANKTEDGHGDWPAPPVQTGWWCAQCGNVDAPQPCIGVCVWRQTEWVNLTLCQAGIDRIDEDFRAAREMGRILDRLVAVTPHAGRCLDNWRALQAQARAAFEQPETQSGGRPTSVADKGKQRSQTHLT